MKSDNDSGDNKKIVRTLAVERLTHALFILATGKGDARQRVSHAYLACRTLTQKNLPHELAKDWKLITKEVTKLGPIVDGVGNVVVGSVENTMRNRRMTSSTAAKIAHRIWRLYWAVSENEEYK